jgi:hypothetical protein
MGAKNTTSNDIKIIDDEVNFWEPLAAQVLVLMPHTPFCDVVFTSFTS